MAEQELWTELLVQAQGRYRVMNEIFHLTQEIADALSRDDRVSVQMLLGMRQDEIGHLSESEQRIFSLFGCVPLEERRELEGLLRGEGKISEEDAFEKRKLGEIGNNIQVVLTRIVDLDRAVSIRLAGKDSVYSGR